MKKEKYLQLFLVICMAGLILICLKYVEVQNSNKELQHSINNAFRHQLSNVLGSFSVEVNDYTYRDMLSNVFSAARMSELTTYEDRNDELDIILHNLYFSLREEKSKDSILSKVDELRDIFLLLVQDPANKEATDKLSLLTNETFFSVEDISI